MNTTDWSPSGPYLLKTGKYSGKSLEYVLLHDPRHLLFMWQKIMDHMNNNNALVNNYQRHIIWLVSQFNKLTASVVCSKCKQQNGKFLIGVGSYREGYRFIPKALCSSCYNEEQVHGKTTSLRLSIEAIRDFSSKASQQSAWNSIRQVLGLDKGTYAKDFFQILRELWLFALQCRAFSFKKLLPVLINFANLKIIGEVPEWFNGTVLKTVVRASGPRVRISPSPPNYISKHYSSTT